MAHPDACPDEATLRRHGRQELPVEEAAAVARHVADCERCAGLIDTLPGIAPLAAPLPSRPRAVGRYVVQRELGRGAMGVVLLAHDALLARNVALKVVNAPPGDAPGLSAQVAREAQAVARLQHPNVVALFDVFQQGGEVFLAMEYVEGEDLADWLRVPRSAAEIVAIFLQAAAGLAAAHAAGVVHRDFKPANVLVGKDGRARVSDFGLASFIAERRESAGGASDVALTAATLGTPAYMAPEQWAARPAGPPADQFAFCVALYEALVGARPFEGDTFSALRTAVLEGKRRAAPGGRSLPRGLSAIIERGLAVDPAARFASMAQLRAALVAVVSPRRRWLVLAAGAVLVAGVVFGWLATSLTARARCQDPLIHLAQLFDARAQQRLTGAFGQLQQGWATAAGARAQRRLSAFAEGWARMRTEACEATERAEQSEALLDRRMLCLEERRESFRATLEVLARGDAVTASRSDAVLDELGDVSACADSRALLDGAARPADPAARARVTAAEAKVVEARARQAAGQFREALPLARAARAELEASGSPWDEAAAWLRVGSIERELGEASAAESLGRAVELAMRSRNAAVESLAWTERVEVASSPAAALELEGVARAALARVAGLSGEKEPALVARLEGALGVQAREAGEFERAARHFKGELDAAQRVPEGGLLVARAWQHQGSVAASLEHQDEAIGLQRQAVELTTRLAGPEHPQTGGAVHDLAWALLRARRFDEAGQRFEEALRITQAALGERHLEVADALDGLGWLKSQTGREAEAEPLLTRALELRLALAGADSPRVARSYNNLGSLLLMTKRPSEAARMLAQAARIYEKELGPLHPRLALAMHNLSEAQLAAGDVPAALQSASRSFAISLQKYGPDSPVMVSEYTSLAQMEASAGRRTEAMRHYELALAIPAAEVSDVALAKLRFAQLLADGPGADPARARRLVAEARPFYEDERRAGRLLGEVAELDQLATRLRR